MPSRLLIISELYYPEETSTGYFITGIAEGLAETGSFSVYVLCSQPTYAQRGLHAATTETHNGVRIDRIRAPIGNKNRKFGRLWNMLSLTSRFLWLLLFRIRRDDLVLVVTNPPILPAVVGLISKVKGANPYLLVHDVFPDILVPGGITTATSLVYRTFDAIQTLTLRLIPRVVVLGRDMHRRLAAKRPNRSSQIYEIIPNWGDGTIINPAKRNDNPVRKQLNLERKFIIQFSGNFGRTHGLEDLIQLASQLSSNDMVHFLVFGSGAGLDWLKTRIAEMDLPNLTLLPPCEQSDLGNYLTACDLFYMPFKRGMEGISVPSRLYNVMAAGNPVLAVAHPESELALVVEEEAMGWVVEPGDVEHMKEIVLAALEDSETLRVMGNNARAAQQRKYTKDCVVDSYSRLFSSTNAVSSK